MLAQPPVLRVSQSCVAGVRKQPIHLSIEPATARQAVSARFWLFLACVDTLARCFAARVIEGHRGRLDHYARRTTDQSCAQLDQQSEQRSKAAA
jgi:hypothetical protein